MKPVAKELLDRLIAEMAVRLRGEWVLMDGAVLPLIGIDHRPTYDIDLAGPEDCPQMFELFAVANSVGLPVEAVNQAASFFLYRIKGWHDHLIPVLISHDFALYRPDATLYLLTKLPRLSESDLEDCLKYLNFALSRGEPFESDRIRRAIQKELRSVINEQRRKRLQSLLEALRARMPRKRQCKR